MQRALPWVWRFPNLPLFRKSQVTAASLSCIPWWLAQKEELMEGTRSKVRGATNSCPSCGSVSVWEETELFVRTEETVAMNRGQEMWPPYSIPLPTSSFELRVYAFLSGWVVASIPLPFHFFVLALLCGITLLQFCCFKFYFLLSYLFVHLLVCDKIGWTVTVPEYSHSLIL